MHQVHSGAHQEYYSHTRNTLDTHKENPGHTKKHFRHTNNTIDTPIHSEHTKLWIYHNHFRHARHKHSRVLWTHYERFEHTRRTLWTHTKDTLNTRQEHLGHTLRRLGTPRTLWGYLEDRTHKGFTGNTTISDTPRTPGKTETTSGIPWIPGKHEERFWHVIYTTQHTGHTKNTGTYQERRGHVANTSKTLWDTPKNTLDTPSL